MRMYNREKNNTSTAIYPKCHNTKRKECLVPILFFLLLPFLFFWTLLLHAFPLLLYERSLIHICTHEQAIRKLSTVGDHLYVGYSEKWQSCSSSWTGKKRKGKREKWAAFSFWETPLARLFVRCLFRLVSDCPDVLYKGYPYTSCHTHAKSRLWWG